MQITSLLPIALSLFTTTASATTAIPLRIAADSPALTWHVSNFTVGCSPGGCVYDFSIYGVGTSNTPGFNTTCSGVAADEDYVECQDENVLADLVYLPYPTWNLKVEHRWRQGQYGEQQFFAYGQKNITVGTERFTIPVTEVYGVA